MMKGSSAFVAVILGGVVAVCAACGSSASGTTHASPGLASVDQAPSAPATPVAAPAAPASGAGDAGIPKVPPSTVHCAGKTGASGDSTLNLMSGGYARDSLLHVPPGYDPTKGSMLVLNFHGFTSNAPEQVLLTGMNPVADDRGFVVAYPDGLGNGWNAGSCCTELQPGTIDDVQFTKDLLALIESEYCIDPSRVYATGFSNGGFFSHRLGCEMADTFAAIAPVSGVLGIPFDQCKPSRPVPVLHIHGTADPVVPYDGGPALKLLPPIMFLPVEDTIDFWRGADSCLGAGTIFFQHGDATCTRYDSCNGSGVVELCALEGDGHQWPDSSIVVPGLGNDSTSLDATASIADFFIAHPM